MRVGGGGGQICVLFMVDTKPFCHKFSPFSENVKSKTFSTPNSKPNNNQLNNDKEEESEKLKKTIRYLQFLLMDSGQ